MARKVQVILSDDLDENLTADETVSFSLDGTSYEIDLADKTAKEMRDALARYVSAARKGGRGGTRAPGGGAPRPRPVRPAPPQGGPWRHPCLRRRALPRNGWPHGPRAGRRDPRLG